MTPNRDMENFYTVYSEVDIAGNKKQELKRIRQKRGHEIIKSYPDLKNLFKGNLRLAYPNLIYNGGEISKVQYAVPADRDDIEKISAFDFNHSIRDQVKQEFEKFKNQSKELGNTIDDGQKKQLIHSFPLPENFDEAGYNFLIKVGSTLYLLNWGFYHLEIDDVKLISDDASNLTIRLSKVDDEDSISIKAELSADAKDYKFEWEIDGVPYTGQSGKTLKIKSEFLQKLDEEFKVKLRVRHSERHAESQSRIGSFRNRFYSPDLPNNDDDKDDNVDNIEPPVDILTVEILPSGNHAYTAELNIKPDDVEAVDYEWKLNGEHVIGNSDFIKLEHEHLKGLPRNSTLSVTVTGIFDGNEEEAIAERKLKLSLWDRFLAWWSDPDNRKKFYIALALILLVILFLFWLNRNPTSDRSSRSERTSSQTTNILPSDNSGQTTDQNGSDEESLVRPEQIVGSTNGSDSGTPPVSGDQPLPPLQDQNEPAPPYIPRGNNSENELSPTQIREIESSPDSGPTKIGDIFCVESAGKVKVWMELSGGNIYILDSYSSEQGNCSQYYPGN